MNYTIEAFIILRNSNMFVVQLTMTYLVGRDGNITNVETHNWLWEDLSGSSTGSPWEQCFRRVCVCARSLRAVCDHVVVLSAPEPAFPETVLFLSLNSLH